MEEQIKNTAIAEQTMAKTRHQSQPFNPKATLLLDVLPEGSVKPAEPTEKLSHDFLPNTKTQPDRTPFIKRKWQLVSLLAGILLIAALVAIGWLYRQTSATATLQAENQSLKEQVTLAGSQITDLKNEMESLTNRNTELTAENAKLKSQNTSPAVASKQSAPAAGATKKVPYPKGTTKAELIAAIGEPDRVYNARGYEQLVYFGKNPGRFWLANGRLVQTGG